MYFGYILSPCRTQKAPFTIQLQQYNRQGRRHGKLSALSEKTRASFCTKCELYVDLLREAQGNCSSAQGTRQLSFKRKKRGFG